MHEENLLRGLFIASLERKSRSLWQIFAVLFFILGKKQQICGKRIIYLYGEWISMSRFVVKIVDRKEYEIYN